MVDLKQAERPIGLETPLGQDTLVLTAFSGEERMSGLFRFELQMLSEDGDIKPDQIVGQAVNFYVRHPDDEKRYFNGIVNRFVYAGKNDRVHMYRAQVVPWLWLLTKGSDCREHEADGQNNAKAIIDGLLGDLGFSDYSWDLKRTPEKREYCVQYRETHFDFLSRLLAEEGIYYYFKHEQGKHELVMTDHVEGVVDCKDAEASLQANLSQPEVTDNLSSWHHEYEFTSGKFAHTDYNFEKPTSSLETKTDSLVKLTGNSQLEFYDHPGRFHEKGLGSDIAQLRMEAEEAAHDTVTGSSVCRSFSPGGRFQLTKHHNQNEQGEKWVLTEVHHSAQQGGSYLTGAASSDEIYSNSFRCIPAKTVFRPPHQPKPQVHGLQSAVVVGPSGDEIYTDQYGRVKVEFHWDRIDKGDEKSSFWVRVSTPWAGTNWGMVHIPRIGQEVIIEFLEGDPDRPIVTGMLYNKQNMPPYQLPDNMTQSGIKTRSSKNGSKDNFNELRFEDKKGEEEIYIHAEKDLNCVVENNETRKVGYEGQKKGDQEIDIYNDQKLQIGLGSADGSQTVEIHKDRDVTLKTGNDGLTIETGNQKTDLQSGKSTTQAMQAIELKVGNNSITIDQTGIKIKGMQVTIEGTTKAELKAPMTNVKGDAMLVIKGGLTMIN
ncbi:MAG: type VI secretion system tip protein VgrG [Fuerstiella sp.]